MGNSNKNKNKITIKEDKLINGKDEKIKDLKFIKTLATDSFTYGLNKQFCVFKSINDIFYLIYSEENNNIINYDIIKDQKINIIKNAHSQCIASIRHFLDKNNKRDLVISISAEDNNFKLWNAKDFSLILNIKNINKEGYLHSAYCFNDNNQIYIVTSNFGNLYNNRSIQVFDIKGKRIKSIKCKSDIYFIDIYHDKLSSKNYIVSANEDNVISYDYYTGKLYNKYDDNEKIDFKYIVITINDNDKNLILLIESNQNEFIRIWDFHLGNLIKKINTNNIRVKCICLLNNLTLVVGCMDCSIKLINIIKGEINYEIIGHTREIYCIEKIFINGSGQYFLSQGWDGRINLWIYQ